MEIAVDSYETEATVHPALAFIVFRAGMDRCTVAFPHLPNGSWLLESMDAAPAEKFELLGTLRMLKRDERQDLPTNVVTVD